MYNFAAESFHTKKLCSRLHSIEVEFYFLNKKSFFELPFGRLRGNLRTPSIARWKARGQLPIRHDWTFFANSYGWDVINGNLSKSAFFEWGGSLWAQISDGRGRRPPSTVSAAKAEWLPFRVISKYPQCIVWFCHKARVWHTEKQTNRQTDRHTDRHTDGQIYDS